MWILGILFAIFIILLFYSACKLNHDLDEQSELYFKNKKAEEVANENESTENEKENL